MSININKLNEKYDEVLNSNEKAISKIEEYLALINSNGCENIVKLQSEKVVRFLEAGLGIMITVNNMNFKLINIIADSFEEDIKTNNEKILNAKNKAISCKNSAKDMHLKHAKLFKDYNIIIKEYCLKSYSEKKDIIESYKKLCNVIINSINNYSYMVKTYVEGYIKCTNMINQTKDIMRNQEYQKNSEWQIINVHGFSINKMYEANPYYNPNITNSKKLRCTNEYREWSINTLSKMKTSHLKTLKEMNINPNKPMKIELEFKMVKGCDTDNPIKSFIDTLVKFYNLSDDNNFISINTTRSIAYANSYSEGTIKFKVKV